VHGRYDPTVSAKLNGRTTTSAALAPVSLARGQSTSYAVKVNGLNQSQGPLRVGFYLPGDVNGDGIVDRTDLQAIRKALGSRYGDPNYKIDADADRDGLINRQDLINAQRNLGVRTSVVPTFVINPDPSTIDPHKLTTTVQTLMFTGTATPGATVTLLDSQGNGAPATGTADSSGNIHVLTHLAAGFNEFQATAKDTFGQSITVLTLPIAYMPPSSS
jgi:hypothetical protein